MISSKLGRRVTIDVEPRGEETTRIQQNPQFYEHDDTDLIAAEDNSISIYCNNDGGESDNENSDQAREQVSQLSQEFSFNIDFSALISEDENSNLTSVISEEETRQQIKAAEECEKLHAQQQNGNLHQAVAAPKVDSLDDFDYDELVRNAKLPYNNGEAFQTKKRARDDFNQKSGCGNGIDFASKEKQAIVARVVATEEQKVQPPQKRPEKQAKITDLFSRDNTATSTGKSDRLKESESIMFHCGKMYRSGDTWESTSKMSGHLFTIRRMFWGVIDGKRMKTAECDHFIQFSATLIGPEESKRLPVDVARFIDASSPDGVRIMPLQLLTKRLNHQPPSSHYIWQGSEKETKGVGFNIACHCPILPGTTPPDPLECIPVLLDLFAGCGGTSIGFQEEGFSVRYSVEIDRAAAATLKVNHPDTLVFEDDVKYFIEDCKTKRTQTHPVGSHVLHVSSPCPGFSSANRNGGQNDTANNNLSSYFPIGMEVFQSRNGSFENVWGMVKDPKNLHHIQKMLVDLLLRSCHFRLFIASSVDFGDAQDRQRVFVFAARNDCILPDAPEPTHGKGREHPHVTAKDALCTLETVEPVRGSGLVELADGKTVVWNHNKEKTEPGDNLKEMQLLVEDEPAKTVLRQKPIRHYSLPRLLTIRERARLQSFPDSYRFCGTLKQQGDQIGNAVPINLARAIARSMKKALQPDM